MVREVSFRNEYDTTKFSKTFLSVIFHNSVQNTKLNTFENLTKCCNSKYNFVEVFLITDFLPWLILKADMARLIFTNTRLQSGELKNGGEGGVGEGVGVGN